MGRPIPYDYRVKIIRDHQSGKGVKQIAEDLNYSFEGVRQIWRRYRKEGEKGLQTDLSRCGRKSPFGTDIRQKILEVKTGEQGAPYIRSVLLARYPDVPIPHERTIQQWWKNAGQNQERGKGRRKKSTWTQEVHHTWQIDGKEQIALQSGEEVSWLNIADEASGADLQVSVFPPTHHE